MTDKTHQLIGVTSATAIFLSIHPITPITWPIIGVVVIGASIGSFSPDIDQPSAPLWHNLPIVGHLVGKVASVGLGGHRNLSHSLLGVFLFGLLFGWITRIIPGNFDHYLLWWSLMIGFAFHLLADSVTVTGIPIFWPFGGYMGFPPHPFQGARIETGKWFENLIIFPAVFIILIILVYANASRFHLF